MEVRDPTYVIQFIEYLNTSGSFKNCKQVVWGGGEPTLDKSFDLIIKKFIVMLIQICIIELYKFCKISPNY